MSSIDLHSHSTVSDGLLSPTQLVRHAAERGVQVLALTDHDGTSGLSEARQAAEMCRVVLIDGTEISVSWRNHTLHIVGLKIDPGHPALMALLEKNAGSRMERARQIAGQLEKIGIKESLNGALEFAQNEQIIGRAHFARFLVRQGYAKDLKQVFKKFLVKGKPGYVPHNWAALSDAVSAITLSGGIAVIAHPGRYDLGKNNLKLLFAEFKEHGGTAIEVVTGSHSPDQYLTFANHARAHGFLASCGSDFHGPDESYMEMGRLPALPYGCDPIWRDWPEVSVN